MDVSLYTTVPSTGQEYRINDAFGLQWFSHYGADGAGFGYLTWRVKRRVGFDYHDLGYGYTVVLYKGPFRCLFDGVLTRIHERSSSTGDELEIWALGMIHVAGADTYNWVYADTRYTEWRGDETPDAPFHPERFDVDTNERLYLKPRRGDHEDGNYTYLRYNFDFGEAAARFVADYDVAMPALFPARVEVLADSTVLWSVTATGSGSVDLAVTGTPTTFEVRLYVTADGEVTAEDDTVYALFENVVVYSENLSLLDGKTIADDIAARLVAHGLSADTRSIQSPGLALIPAAFDTDLTCTDILNWVAQFGDEDGNPLAWGVTFDAMRRLFLETENTNVRYVVGRQAVSLERGGDLSESAQVVYGIYTDENGQLQRTTDVEDATMREQLSGYYRRQGIQLEVTSADQAAAALSVWLQENSSPLLSGSFVVADGVTTPDGRQVPFDELVPGGYVQVAEWNAIEATLEEQSFQDRAVTFPLVGVQVDYDAGTCELIPSETSDAFTRYIATVTQLMGV